MTKLAQVLNDVKILFDMSMTANLNTLQKAALSTLERQFEGLETARNVSLDDKFALINFINKVDEQALLAGTLDGYWHAIIHVFENYEANPSRGYEEYILKLHPKNDYIRELQILTQEELS